MRLILDDYVCSNSTCLKFNKPEEHFVCKNSLQPLVCEECGGQLKKVLSAPKRHGSWSNWRII